METRVCSVCGTKKLLTEDFFRKTIFLKADGTEGISFMRKCLVCHNKWQTENYAKRLLPKENVGCSTCKYCGKMAEDREFETAFMCMSCYKIKKVELDKKY